MSRTFQPTAEQTVVIDSAHPRVIVAASAGSGKTTTLAYRYARLTQEVPPHRILVLAFNVGAAASIKRRIVQILRDSNREETAMAAETAPIQTLASFADGITRENSFALGIDPKFENLTSADASLLIRQSIRAAIAHSAHLPPECNRFIQRVGQKSRQTLVDEAERQVDQVVQLIRRTSPPVGFSSSRVYYQSQYRDADCLQTEWATRLRAALPAAAQRDIPELPYGMLIAATRDWFRQNPPLPTWTNGQPGAEAADIETTIGVVMLAVEAWRRLDERMHQRQTFDYTAVENMALQLLTNPEPRFRAARESVRHRFDHLIVDEAQDIDPLQDRILTEIEVPNEMRVGDAQQSIYSFRLADPEQFSYRAGQAEWQRLNLSTNHRSEAAILEFVNRGFNLLWSNQYVPMTVPVSENEPAFDFDAPESAPHAPSVLAWESGMNSVDTIAYGVWDLIERGEKPNRIAILLDSNANVTRVSQALAARGIPSQIIGGARSFYERMEIRDVANALRAVSDPTDDFALLALLHSPFADLDLDFVVDFGLTGNVFSRLQEIEDDERIQRFRDWFVPLLPDAQGLPAWEILGLMIARSPLMNRLAEIPLGRRAIANVRKLQQLAIDQPQLNAAQFAASLNDVQTITHDVTDAELFGDSDQVSVLTIHQAKGLEFPVVVLPTTAFAPWTGSEGLGSDLRMPAIAAKPSPKAKGGAMSSFLQARREERNRAENLRRVYVALTRAENRLIIVKDRNASTSPLQRWFNTSGPAAGLPVTNFDSPNA